LAAASRFPRRFPEEMGAIFHCAPRETSLVGLNRCFWFSVVGLTLPSQTDEFGHLLNASLV